MIAPNNNWWGRTRVALIEALKKLPSGRDRTVALMYVEAQMTYQKIGAKIGVSTERARQLVVRAVRSA